MAFLVPTTRYSDDERVFYYFDFGDPPKDCPKK
jgi:hypothetical protein